MPNGIGELAYIIIDCLDAQRVATFWGQVLGLEITQKSPPYLDLARSSESAPVISFQEVPEPKTVKNRMHLDVRAEDLDDAEARITELGGNLVRRCVEPPYEWRVMADPEGNEFCLVLG